MEGIADEVDEEVSFCDTLHDLVSFCSETVVEWRMIYKEWTYSELIRASLAKVGHVNALNESVAKFKDPYSMMVFLLMQKS